MSAWERVQLSRAADRASALDYIENVFTDFTELHGDRLYADDAAVVGGIAYFQGLPVTVILILHFKLALLFPSSLIKQPAHGF